MFYTHIYHDFYFCLPLTNLYFPIQFIDEKRRIFLEIMQVIQTQQGGLLFLYGYGRTGKTIM